MNVQLIAAHSALTQGRKSEAADKLISAVTEDISCGIQAFSPLLNLLLELGRYEEGATWAARAVETASKNYSFWNLYGAFLRLSGRRREALKVFDAAIKLRPGELAAHVNKGHTLNDLGEGANAEIIFAKAIRKEPRLSELHRGLAKALALQHKFKEADRRLRQALALNNKDCDSWLDLSAVAFERADLDGAIATLNRGLAAIPDDGRLAKAKAVMLWSAGRAGEAAAFLTALLPQHGDAAWLHHELGKSVGAINPQEATAHHRRAIQLSPNNVEYRLFFAEHLLRSPGDIQGEAFDYAYKILLGCPSNGTQSASQCRIRSQIFNRLADFARASDVGDFQQLGRVWAKAGFHTALLDHLSRVKSREDRRELIHQHRLWGDLVVERAKRNPITHPRTLAPKNKKIRLGIMSSDLREHPVSYFAWPLFEHADRDRFEIFCYSFFRGDEPGRMQRHIASHVDVFRWNPFMSDREAAQMIADDQLDILFELGGSTHMNKLEVMAWKPAPICASWLGYPHSAGLDTIDYLLVDPFLTPPDPDLLIEQPLIMPRSWVAMSSLAFPGDHVIERLAPVGRNGHVTFGTASNPYKYTSSMLCAWARIVALVPNSRFIFVRPEAGSKVFISNVLAGFAAEGVSPDRIEFRPVRGTHMTHYNDIDIALDTFPQTGGTTTCEAAWMGVPTVTLVGEALFERLSHSILQNTGLGDLCANTTDEFIDIAVRLAGDTDRIQSLRIGLRDQIRASPLGQTEQFARDFYDLVHRTVEAHAGSAQDIV